MTNSKTELHTIFDIEYGNQYDLNKMKEPVGSRGVAFVSRKSGDLGVKTFVEKTKEEPYAEGLITVALGGSILTTGVQQFPFYTAQNIKVLKPKKDLSFREKVFYCMCIEKNKYRYSTMGREANRSLDKLRVPDTIPSWIKKIDLADQKLDKQPLTNDDIDIYSVPWEEFYYKELFEIDSGKGPRIRDTPPGETPMVTATTDNNGINTFLDHEPTHPGGVISVARNGKGVGAAFYQPVPFCSNEDVRVFKPKFEMDVYTALFFVTLIRKERYRFNYGRKWGTRRMRKTKFELPITDNGVPNYELIRNYIQSLNFSKCIAKYDKSNEIRSIQRNIHQF